MSASFLRATAKASPGDNTNESAPAPEPMSPEAKAQWDAVLGGDNNEELTADALQRAQALTNGETPSTAPAVKKPDGDVAADGKTPTAEEIAASEAATAEAAKTVGNTPEEIAAEAAKTPEELAADAAAAEAAQTPEEITAAEEARVAALSPEEKAAENKAAEDAAKAEALKNDDDDDKDKVRVRLNRNNFQSDEDFKIARASTRLMNEFGLSPAKAEEKAREMLGMVKPAEASTIEIPEVADVKAAETEYAEAKKEFRAARAIMDSDAQDAAEDKLEAAKTKLDTARKSVEVAQTVSAQHEQGVARAVAEFPGSNDLSTPLGKLVAGVYAAKPASDPFWKLSAVDRPLAAAKEAAEALGIKGKTTAATSPSVTAKAPAPTKPAKVSPVPGRARTVTPTATPEAAADAELAKVLGKNAHMLAGIHS